jgi:Fe-S cluster assembly protein SufD
VFLGSLARAVQDHPYQVVPHLAQLANQEGHPFTALNTAFLHDGAFLYFPRGRVVEEPIVLLFVAVSPAKASFTSPRVLIVAEANSQARLVEDYVGLDQGVYFTNAVTELKAAEGAILDHYLLQRESPSGFHLGQIQARLERSSRLRAHSLNFGGQLVRNEIHVALAGEGSECSLNGLYLGRGQQLIDNHTRIDHARAHCTSHQLYKGILDGQARGVFCGRIHVHQDAQKTDARQTNQTLLLSNDALINTQPQLEIYADDVKCTHGATVGQLDTECLFYLRSRGLSETEARRLLVFAFANDIINRVEIEALRSRLEGDLLANQSLARPARAK